jgi:hypothetical protein
VYKKSYIIQLRKRTLRATSCVFQGSISAHYKHKCSRTIYFYWFWIFLSIMCMYLQKSIRSLLRISNKYGSLTRKKVPMKNVTTVTRPSADWWVLTTTNAAGTNGLTKHGGTRNNKFLVTHPMTDQRCLTSAIASGGTLTAGPSRSSDGDGLTICHMCSTFHG